MALIKCRECGNSVSTEAVACPHCGAPQKAVPPQLPPQIIVQQQPPPKQGVGFFGGCFAVLVVLFAVGAIIVSIDKSTKENDGSTAPVTTPAIPLERTEPPKGPPPDNFRGIKWGGPPPNGLKQVGTPSREGVVIYTTPEGKQPEPFLELPVKEEDYQFDNDKLYGGSVYLDGKENFDKIKAELTKQYGEPTFANPRIWLWKWKWKDSKIEVMLSYQERFARTTVGFQNKGI